MEKDDQNVYMFKNFDTIPDLSHAVYTRKGGESLPPFDLLNVGLNAGDENNTVKENRKRIALDMKMRPVIYLNQEHGDTIQLIRKGDNDLARVFEPGKDLYTADGVITDMSGIYLVIQVADCQSVMMYDPSRRVVANVHSGWRGSVQNIVGKCIDTMVAEFDCKSSDIMVGISPSLGPCCAEFVNYRDEIPKNLWKYQTDYPNMFDFWKITEDQLKEKGVGQENIENMNICTKCRSDLFFSYRKEKITGRFACVIGMD